MHCGDWVEGGRPVGSHYFGLMTKLTTYPCPNAEAQEEAIGAMCTLMEGLANPDCGLSSEEQIQGWRSLTLNFVAITEALSKEREEARARVAELEAQNQPLAITPERLKAFVDGIRKMAGDMAGIYDDQEVLDEVTGCMAGGYCPSGFGFVEVHFSLLLDFADRMREIFDLPETMSDTEAFTKALEQLVEVDAAGLLRRLVSTKGSVA